MRKLVDQQLKRNDCGISAVKTVCNILDVDITRTLIEDNIHLDEEGSTLESLNKFFEEYGFETNFKLFDFRSVNGNQPELNEIFPCIVPVKRKRGLHYVVVNSLKNYNFEILDPAKTTPYKQHIDEFKTEVFYSSSYLPFVDVEENLSYQVNKNLAKYDVKLNFVPNHLQLTEIFNKLSYFTYVEEKYGFKTPEASKAFLEDLIYNQELKHIPKHFKELGYKKETLKIKAPVFLSVKKTEDTKNVTSDATTNAYWRLFKTIGSIKELWYIFLATAMLGTAISYVSTFINQVLIDHILPSFQITTLNVFIMGVAIFFLVEQTFSIYKRYVSIHLSNAFDRYFMKMFDTKLSTFSIRYLQSYKRGDLTERLSDTMRMKSFFTNYFASIIVEVLIAITSMFFLFMIHAKLSLLVLVVLVLYAVLFYVFTPIIENLERKRYQSKATFMSKFIEKIDGIQSIKALGLEAYSSSQILASIEDLIKIQTKSKYVGMANAVLTAVISTAATLGLLLLTSRELILHNTMTLGMIVTFLSLSGKIFGAFKNLLDKNLTLQEHKVILARVFEFDENKFKELERANDHDEANNNEIKTNSNLPNKVNFNKIRSFEFKKLTLKDVFFTYDNIKNTIEDINLEINAGDKIMIRGKNGSGKSTLCKIMGMLYDPSGGEIMINDIDKSIYERKNLRKKIVFISGEDILFNETFLFNVAFGKKIDMQKLVEYSKVLGLYDFIQKKTDKFEFVIYENGRNLSTGQRKKVLLLRALMSDAKLVILDEIFNGLDVESKDQAELLISYIQDKTFVIVSHMKAEKIHLNKEFIIENGRLSIQNA